MGEHVHRLPAGRKGGEPALKMGLRNASVIPAMLFSPQVVDNDLVRSCEEIHPLEVVLGFLREHFDQQRCQVTLW